ncbi:HU family DNA-binding protein [Prevotella bivia]|uniref:HU family DNA-binding protein n=1 Tax=Prevotella bivia TaxID=28125 RepID=UPI00288A12FB|nr:HU family DNA-binding protein [Prevotella bivia]
MTKKEILSKVMVTTDLTRSQAAKAYNAIISAIKSSLIKGEDVTLRGFATLKVVHVKERVSGLHGKKTVIPAHKTVKIKACQELKKLINK